MEKSFNSIKACVLNDFKKKKCLIEELRALQITS